MEINPAAQQTRTWRIVITTALLAIATYYLLPPEVNELARRTAAIFVVAAIFWATEVIPLFATSLLVIAMEIFFVAHVGGFAGVLPARSDFPVNAVTQEALELQFSVFLRPFSSGIIILFLGGFLISAAMVKTGLDSAIAAKFLRRFSTRPVILLFAVLGITAFFSMWMSNTATAAMMIVIVSPFLKGLPAGHKFATALLLAVAFGANVGGIGTPIGTPPNAVALDSLRRAGFEVGFLDWMIMAVPLALLLLVATGLLLVMFFPPGKDLVLPKLPDAGRITWPARVTLIVLVLAIAMWLTERVHGVEAAVIALAAAAALATFRVLGRKEINTIDWDILVLMWGGLSLGEAMRATQLVNYVDMLPIAGLHGLVLATIIIGITVALSTFMSNTAAANMLVPMAMTIAQTTSDNPGEPVQMAVLVGLSCSFAMAMPVSTPPNAIVFGSGQITVRSMILVGSLVSVTAMLVVLSGYQWILPWLIDRVVAP